jgi:hypothetical protein
MASLAPGPLFPGADEIKRSVWVVVDPIDLVTGQRILTPLSVRLKDVSAQPITGRSGVYCFTDLHLPEARYTIQVAPWREGRDHYFQAQQDFDLHSIPDSGAPVARNPVSIALLPRPAYPFAAGVTLARGRLITASVHSGLAGADIRLFRGAVDEGVRTRADERGEFAVFFAPEAPTDTEEATLKDVKFRLRFEVAGRPSFTTDEKTVKEGSTLALKEIEFPGT